MDGLSSAPPLGGPLGGGPSKPDDGILYRPARSQLSSSTSPHRGGIRTSSSPQAHRVMTADNNNVSSPSVSPRLQRNASYFNHTPDFRKKAVENLVSHHTPPKPCIRSLAEPSSSPSTKAAAMSPRYRLRTLERARCAPPTNPPSVVLSPDYVNQVVDRLKVPKAETAMYLSTGEEPRPWHNTLRPYKHQYFRLHMSPRHQHRRRPHHPRHPEDEAEANGMYDYYDDENDNGHHHHHGVDEGVQCYTPPEAFRTGDNNNHHRTLGNDDHRSGEEKMAALCMQIQSAPGSQQRTTTETT
eukprot:PhF_6_TR21049/c0_g1_i2/m.30300